VSVALSKGLCAPGGSVLAGSRSIVQRAVRYRRMFGGAMRQVGIFAAAGIFAIDHHLARLRDDHANATRVAQRLAKSSRVVLDMASVQTNIVMFHVTADAPDAATIVARAGEQGVLLFAFGPRTMRLVTHADVTAEQCSRAAEVLAAICES
jgi:threonine aldolase